MESEFPSSIRCRGVSSSYGGYDHRWKQPGWIVREADVDKHGSTRRRSSQGSEVEELPSSPTIVYNRTIGPLNGPLNGPLFGYEQFIDDSCLAHYFRKPTYRSGGTRTEKERA